MPSKKVASNDGPVTLTSRDTTRIVVVLVGLALIATAMFTPWWTRGFTVDFSDDNPRSVEEAGLEGLYWSYGPFSTPGAGSVSVDGYREFATALLGVTVLLSALFISAHLMVRWAMFTNRVETNHDLPVRFAIAAFWLGLVGLLVAAFIVPVAGPNPGWLYGEEAQEESFATDQNGNPVIEDTRFANVGFFTGLLAFGAYPAYLWADAARTRDLHATGAATRTSDTPAY